MDIILLSVGKVKSLMLKLKFLPIQFQANALANLEYLWLYIIIKFTMFPDHFRNGKSPEILNGLTFEQMRAPTSFASHKMQFYDVDIV